MCHGSKTPLLSGNEFTGQLDGFNRIGTEAVCFELHVAAVTADQLGTVHLRRFIDRAAARENVSRGGEHLAGDARGFAARVVPRGDVATRTFPVKIRTPNTQALIEGMTAKVLLPVEKPRNSLLVPRDAVITVSGQTVVYAVNDSKARMIPVNVIGYQGLAAGIQGAGLTDGMQVVVKGNERLRNGQMVSALSENK